MAILTRSGISIGLARGIIICDPPPEKTGPNSMDLRLGNELRAYCLGPHEPLDSRNPPDTFPISIDPLTGGWTLEPGTLYLGSTLERCGTTAESGLVPHLDGRSSLARLGVWAHLAAGRGDVGFVGHWTVELVVVHRTIIYPGARLFQMAFHMVDGMPTSYDGDYANQTGPVASRGIDG